MTKQLFKNPLFVVGFCIVISILIFLTKGSPKKREVEKKGVLVEILELKKSNSPVIVEAYGEVQPLSASNLSLEVSGKITELNQKFKIGGEFKKGETLFKIDSQDYQINVEIAQAEHLKAKEDLERIKAQAQVAKEEWELASKFLNEKAAKSEPSPLVLLTPQLKSAEARLASAEAQLKLAKLNLSRIELKAPYDGYLESKNVDLGEYLRAGEVIGRFVGVDRAEVLISLSADKFWWLKQALEKNKSLKTDVVLTINGSDLHWDGELDRILGSLDARGRFYQAVVSVDKPYEQNPDFPLSVGTFVSLKVDAGVLEETYPIPRAALKDEDTIWLASTDKKLEKRKIEVLRLTREMAYISSDNLAEGEKLIITQLKAASSGMKLRFEAEEVE